ncbi:MAG: hypothetical protein ACTS6A_01455 [Candidatus Hodgkinia cicadicola]
MGSSKWTCALRGNIIHLRVLLRKNSASCTRLLKLVKLNFIKPKAFGRSESLMEIKIERNSINQPESLKNGVNV